VGLNAVGLRRAAYISDEDRRQIREAFNITYRAGLTTPHALKRMDQCADWGQAATKFRDFVRQVTQAQKPYNRPLCPLGRSRRTREE
jgi:acyl-[acyl carrier protein]--UDP-N-acetylglucosamine O-acyltransferase